MNTLPLTIFKDRNAFEKRDVDLSWDDFCARLDPGVVVEHDAKAHCALIKLAQFGEDKSERGSYRHDRNLIALSGAECDYDGETLMPRKAALMLADAGIKSLVCTSPGHMPDAPRFRVFVPFDDVVRGAPEVLAAVRREAVEKVNGVLGGVLSSESFTASQPFYYGRVKGREYETYRVSGSDVRGLPLARLGWRGARIAEGAGAFTPDATFVALLEDGEEVHPSINALAWRGWTREELEDVLERSRLKTDKPNRWEVAMREDIPRCVESASRKREEAQSRLFEKFGTPPEMTQLEVVVEAPVFDKSRLLRKVSELTASWSPVNWLIRGYLEHPTFCVMFGDPEAGKSFVAIDMACCIATGRPWRGASVRKGRVVYLCGEGHAGIKRRLRAWMIVNGVNPTGLDDMDVSVRPIDMLSQDELSRWREEVESSGPVPVLTIVDTLARMTPSMDHNAGKEMSHYVQICDDIKAAWGCTVLTLAHSGHGDKGRVMGSMVLKGATDVEIGVKREPGGTVHVFNTKMKEANRFGDLYFKLTDVDLPGWFEDAAEEGQPPSKLQHSAVLESISQPAGSEAPAASSDGERKNPTDEIRKLLTYRKSPPGKRELREEFLRIWRDDGRGASTFNICWNKGVAAGVFVYDEDQDECSLFIR